MLVRCGATRLGGRWALSRGVYPPGGGPAPSGGQRSAGPRRRCAVGQILGRNCGSGARPGSCLAWASMSWSLSRPRAQRSAKPGESSVSAGKGAAGPHSKPARALEFAVLWRSDSSTWPRPAFCGRRLSGPEPLPAERVLVGADGRGWSSSQQAFVCSGVSRHSARPRGWPGVRGVSVRPDCDMSAVPGVKAEKACAASWLWPLLPVCRAAVLACASSTRRGVPLCGLRPG